MKLFLDDIRSPIDCLGYMHTKIGARNLMYKEGDWVIVRNFEQFVKYLNGNPVPDVISFDHDLADDHYLIHKSEEAWEEYHTIESRERTGLDCLNYFLAHYTRQFGVKFPEIIFHTMNPVGRDNMQQALLAWKVNNGI